MTDRNKNLKNLDVAIGQIEKAFGRGSVMRLSESNINQNISAIPTGCISLDMALGIGGLPRGRVIEIFGAESAGKSTLAMSVIAQAQKSGGQAAFIDVEHDVCTLFLNQLEAFEETEISTRFYQNSEIMENTWLATKDNFLEPTYAIISGLAFRFQYHAG